jgi:hypothetical protein
MSTLRDIDAPTARKGGKTALNMVLLHLSNLAELLRRLPGFKTRAAKGEDWRIGRPSEAHGIERGVAIIVCLVARTALDFVVLATGKPSFSPMFAAPKHVAHRDPCGASKPSLSSLGAAMHA